MLFSGNIEKQGGWNFHPHTFGPDADLLQLSGGRQQVDVVVLEEHDVDQVVLR